MRFASDTKDALHVCDIGFNFTTLMLTHRYDFATDISPHLHRQRGTANDDLASHCRHCLNRSFKATVHRRLEHAEYALGLRKWLVLGDWFAFLLEHASDDILWWK